MKSEGYNVVKAEDILSQAQIAFEARNYSEALKLAKQAKAKAEAIPNEAKQAKNAIEEAKLTIKKSTGFTIIEAESLVSQAQIAFEAGDYLEAYSLAEKAYSLYDIDKDGILNTEDFAPTINNYYIYSGVVIFLFVSLMTLKAALKRREKFRFEHEIKKQEYRKTEERKPERGSQADIERMKQEILDKIYEVTKK